jgi:WD40 repeat protein
MEAVNPLLGSRKFCIASAECRGRVRNSVDYFFGRDQAVENVKQSLLLYPLTILYGAPGSGKSSLLNAGVVAGLQTYYVGVGADAKQQIKAISIACDELFARERQITDDDIRLTIYSQIYREAGIETTSEYTTSLRDVIRSIQDTVSVPSNGLGGGASPVTISQIWLLLDDVDLLISIPQSNGGLSIFDEIIDIVNSKDENVAFLFSVSDSSVDRINGIEKFSLCPWISFISLERMESNDASEAISNSLKSVLQRSAGDYWDDNNSAGLEKLSSQILDLCEVDDPSESLYSPLYIQMLLTELWEQCHEPSAAIKPKALIEAMIHKTERSCPSERNRLLMSLILRSIDNHIKDHQETKLDLYTILFILTRITAPEHMDASPASIPLDADSITSRCVDFGTIIGLESLRLDRDIVSQALDLLVDIDILRFSFKKQELHPDSNKTSSEGSQPKEYDRQLIKCYELRSPDLRSPLSTLHHFYTSFLASLFKLRQLPLHAAFERSHRNIDLSALLLFLANQVDQDYVLGLRSEINEVSRSLLATFNTGDHYIFGETDTSKPWEMISTIAAITREPSHCISSLLFCDKSSLLICGTVKGKIIIYDLKEGSKYKRYMIDHATWNQRITGLFLLNEASSDDENTLTFLSACEDGTLKRWNLQKGLSKPDESVSSWSWSKMYPDTHEPRGDFFERSDIDKHYNSPASFTCMCGCRECNTIFAGCKDGLVYGLHFDNSKNILSSKPKLEPIQLTASGTDQKSRSSVICMALLGCPHTHHSQKDQHQDYRLVVGLDDGSLIIVDIGLQHSIQTSGISYSFQCNAKKLLHFPGKLPIQTIAYDKIKGILAVAAGDPYPPIIMIWKDLHLNGNNISPCLVLSPPLSKSFKEDLGINCRVTKECLFDECKAFANMERVNVLTFLPNTNDESLLLMAGEDQLIRCISLLPLIGSRQILQAGLIEKNTVMFASSFFGISTLAHSSEGSKLIAGSWSGTTSIFHLKLSFPNNAPLKRSSHDRNIASLAHTMIKYQSEFLLVSSSWDGSIKQWRLPAESSKELTSMRLVPDANVNGVDKEHYGYESLLFEINPDQADLAKNRMHSEVVWKVVFSPKGRFLTATDPRNKRFLNIWNVLELLSSEKATRKSITIIPDTSRFKLCSHDEIRSIAFNASEHLLACGLWSGDSDITRPRLLIHRLCETADSSELCGMIMTSLGITCLWFDPKENILFAATDDRALMVIYIKEDNNKTHLWGKVLTESVDMNERMVIVVNQLETLCEATGTPPCLIEPKAATHDDAPGNNLGYEKVILYSMDIFYCADSGQYLVALGGGDNIIRLWKLEIQIPTNSNTEFSVLVNSHIELVGHRYWIGSLSFSPSGKQLASGSYDGTIRVWELSNVNFDLEDDASSQISDLYPRYRGSPIVLREHNESVTCVQFIDEYRLVSGGYDNNIILWNLSLNDIVKSLRNRVMRNLTTDEWNRFVGRFYHERHDELKRYLRFEYPEDYSFTFLPDKN